MISRGVPRQVFTQTTLDYWLSDRVSLQLKNKGLKPDFYYSVLSTRNFTSLSLIVNYSNFIILLSIFWFYFPYSFPFFESLIFSFFLFVFLLRDFRLFPTRVLFRVPYRSKVFPTQGTLSPRLMLRLFVKKSLDDIVSNPGESSLLTSLNPVRR